MKDLTEAELDALEAVTQTWQAAPIRAALLEGLIAMARRTLAAEEFARRDHARYKESEADLFRLTEAARAVVAEAVRGDWIKRGVPGVWLDKYLCDMDVIHALAAELTARDL
jgi:hypothetical protein